MNRVLFFGMTFLAVAAIGLGFSVVGGPGEARREKSDYARLLDLGVLARELRCDDAKAVLPMTLSTETLAAYCGGVVTHASLTDPETGAPYSYERLSDTSFKLCAKFYNAERIQHHYQDRAGFDRKTGCYTARITS